MYVAVIFRLHYGVQETHVIDQRLNESIVALCITSDVAAFCCEGCTVPGTMGELVGTCNVNL